MFMQICCFPVLSKPQTFEAPKQHCSLFNSPWVKVMSPEEKWRMHLAFTMSYEHQNSAVSAIMSHGSIWASRARAERGSHSVYAEPCVPTCPALERGPAGVCCTHTEHGRLVHKCGGGEGSGRPSQGHGTSWAGQAVAAEESCTCCSLEPTGPSRG